MRGELDVARYAFERRWEVILSRWASVVLEHYEKPLIGLLGVISEPEKK